MFLFISEIATARRPFVEEPTTRQPTLTTTTRATTTRGTTTTGRPRKAEPRREGLVKCFVCGSLFSTDAPDCQKFDFKVQKSNIRFQQYCSTAFVPIFL